jgi:hypothetical protein
VDPVEGGLRQRGIDEGVPSLEQCLQSSRVYWRLIAAEGAHAHPED